MSARAVPAFGLITDRSSLPGVRAALLLGLLMIAFATIADGAWADVLPAVTLDGPSEEIVGFGGAAMAEDGTGGVVYLKRSGGVAHVFVSRFVDGQWQAPIRVDTGEPYAGSWPQIGAGDGGELIVTWATEYALTPPPEEQPRYEMLGAVLAPGSERFGRAIIIDRNINQATGTSPDLAVSSSGQADLVYRVVEQEHGGTVALHPGDVTESVRVAHFDGARWAGLGAVNRDTGVAMRPPNAANAPRIAIGPTGNGVVVWQEPELNGVARLWARRIFGSALDYVMPVSATTYGGAPITDDAEAPAVAFTKLGQAEVAYRQPAGSSSPLPGPRILLNILPDGEAASGAEFQGASAIDEGIGGGKAALVGAPSIDVDERRSVSVVYDANGQPRLVEGNDRGITGAITLGPPFAGPATTAVNAIDPEGGGLVAWPSANPEGRPEVAVLENFPEGGAQTGLVGGGDGGEVSEIAVGRSGLGDGIVGFRQGPVGNASIVAATVSAPPAQSPFVMTLPKAWIRPTQAVASWAPAPSGAGPISYRVVLDGQVQPTPAPAGVLEMHVDTRGLSTGVYVVQILATDRYGESTLTAPSELELADSPPKVVVSREDHGRAVSVKITDPAGLDKSALRVSFGDGAATHGRGSSSHRYPHAGVYLVTASVRDRFGNAGVVRRWVSIR